MSDDQFAKLFKVMTNVSDRLAAVETNMATKEQLNAVYDLLDKNIREHETQEHEQAAMKHQLDRLDRWVRQIATDTGTELRYE